MLQTQDESRMGLDSPGPMFHVKGGVKPDHWGGVKVDQLSMEKI
jgi:hypothetical protein